MGLCLCMYNKTDLKLDLVFFDQNWDARDGEWVAGHSTQTQISSHEQWGTDQLVTLSGWTKTRWKWFKAKANWKRWFPWWDYQSFQMCFSPLSVPFSFGIENFIQKKLSKKIYTQISDMKILFRSFIQNFIIENVELL